jgi:hypothetical protein
MVVWLGVSDNSLNKLVGGAITEVEDGISLIERLQRRGYNDGCNELRRHVACSVRFFNPSSRRVLQTATYQKPYYAPEMLLLDIHVH